MGTHTSSASIDIATTGCCNLSHSKILLEPFLSNYSLRKLLVNMYFSVNSIVFTVSILVSTVGLAVTRVCVDYLIMVVGYTNLYIAVIQ